jgi:PhzF family phenazine biosynthesis protein
VDGDGLTDEAMVRFTRWTNLSEATFLLPPDDPAADYRVRVFMAAGELPFAGHPTLGSCHAWLRAGGRPRDRERIVQECVAGLVAVRRVDGRLAFQAPPMRRQGPVEPADLERATTILGLEPGRFVDAHWVDNGPGWLAIRLLTADEVLALSPALPSGGVGEAVNIGVVGFHPPASECAYEVRAIFSDDRGQLVEDPVTGSLNASLAQGLSGAGLVRAPYVASQGTGLGRVGRAHVSEDADGAIWVAGDTHTLVEGSLDLG